MTLMVTASRALRRLGTISSAIRLFPTSLRDDLDTGAFWKHLTDVFGDKVSALQAELENRIGEQLTPTDRETGNCWDTFQPKETLLMM